MYIKVPPTFTRTLPAPERWTQVKPHKAPCKYTLYVHSSGRLTVVPEETPALSCGALHLPTETLRDLLGVKKVDSALVHDAHTVLTVDRLLAGLYEDPQPSPSNTPTQ